MTIDKDFKKLVRERMEKTGESYTAALRHLRGETRVGAGEVDDGTVYAVEVDGRWSARDPSHPHHVGYGPTKKRLVKYDPTEGIKPFDTSEHPTYTEEQPNSLMKEEMHEFLACIYELFPQHYAMTCLGYATGLRPSSLRCLRRTGEAPDILWDEGVILVRRSATLGEVMDTTKTKYRQRISVAPALIRVLRWHVDHQLHTQQQKESDLLFPSEDGGLRSEACLRKPFVEVGTRIGLNKKFTPKGLRRTFNDAARIADLEGVVTMSISGHRTERMRDLYSSVGADEQRDGISKVLKLVGAIIPEAPAAGSGMPRGMQTPGEVCIHEEPVRKAV